VGAEWVHRSIDLDPAILRGGTNDVHIDLVCTSFRFGHGDRPSSRWWDGIGQLDVHPVELDVAAESAARESGVSLHRERTRRGQDSSDAARS
jgi:hypothetical protein